MLSDKDIRELSVPGVSDPLVEPFDEDSLQPASYDVHLSPYFVDPFDRTDLVDARSKGYFDLKPHKLWLGETSEWFDIPVGFAARVEGRSSWGRLGLMTHLTAGFVDPGFRGTITLELYNVTDRTLRLPVTSGRGAIGTGIEPIAQVCFMELMHRCERPYDVRGHYSGQVGPTPSKLYKFVGEKKKS